ncbi:hypothetical protein DI272_03405 [Streptomyces sp. Act143]|uniref:hypothetical protein n=1 Tax=Streptomyces sp. Act143 TaxID=2200760 RepID=UPI000D6838D5|nr:hypothetical protein [Streptomyces sp. Act143]PWI13284.1 hypothetical protein DI272_03405 [Streptomyces sp. Act143]
MRRPVEGEVHVHYGQIYVESDPDSHGPDLAESFAGQSAGMCGAAVPGALWLSTGLHTGDVGFTVEIHEEPPPLDPQWEDVVEVSFRPASAESRLVQWAWEAAWDLDLAEMDYRVRYCAKGMDRAREEDTRLGSEPQLDCYLLQFWPAPPQADRVVKETSRTAAYWHSYAREQPPPPTPEERAEAERRERLALEQAEREHQQALERWEWGGQSPSQALREVRGNVRGLLPFDPPLVHAIDAAGPEVQRAVALLAARRACEQSGLTALDWVADGLTALAQGCPLPPPFDDWTEMWQTLAADPHAPAGTVGQAVPPERPPFQPSAPRAGVSAAETPQLVGPAAAAAESSSPPREPGRVSWAGSSTMAVTFGAPDPSLRVSQPHMALPAVTGAAEADPLRAALDAVYAGVVTYGEHYETLLREIRAAVPQASDTP